MAKRFLVLVVCLLFVGVGIAQDKTSSFLESLKKHTLEVGPEISHIEYEEPGIMEEEGTMYGIVGCYTYRDWAPLSPAALETGSLSKFGGEIFKVDGRFSWGKVDYDGSYLDGTPLTIDNIDDYILDFRLLWGNDSLSPKSMNTFYAGFGYRYLNDDSSFHPAGYERESNYFYIPLGLQTTNDLGNDWFFGLGGEFDLLIFGIQISHFSDVDPSLPDVENYQWPGYGARCSIKLQKKTKYLDLVVQPFVRYWWIDESDVSEGIIEPRNNSLEYGIHLILRF